MHHIITILFFAALIGGCASTVPEIYKLDIRQGNFLSGEAVDRLQPGMSKDEVQFLLGTPMITDPFNGSRWDYIYSFRPRGNEVSEQRHLSLYFQGDTLARIEPGETIVTDD